MIPILLYHRVADVPATHDPRRLSVRPDQFERHMAALHRWGYHTASLLDVVRSLRNGDTQPKKQVVITFDDGYLDLLAHAQPVLARFDFGATCFLVVDCVGGVSDWDGMAAALLSWSQVRTLSGGGMMFGSHTRTHPRLPHLDDASLHSELRDSRLILADHLSVAVTLLAYPYGRSNARVRQIAAEAGYEAACGVDRGHWELFNLWRAQITGHDTLLSLRWKVRGAYHILIRFREQSPVGQRLRPVVRALRAVLAVGG